MLDLCVSRNKEFAWFQSHALPPLFMIHHDHEVACEFHQANIHSSLGFTGQTQKGEINFQKCFLFVFFSLWIEIGGGFSNLLIPTYDFCS